MRAIAAWDETRRVVNVHLWHPQFGEVPDGVRMQVGFVFLDSLLGEDTVERWIGAIELLEALGDGRTPAELKTEVERRAAEPPGDDTWVLGEMTQSDGSVAFVLVDASLKRIDHPFADHHVTIRQLWGADRLPTDAEMATLSQEEDDFLHRLGDVAVYAGRVTVPGSRTMHFVAEDPDLLRPAIDGWAADLPDSLSPGLPQRRLQINFERDMDWAFRADLGVG
jgi:hypothetical protein